MNSPVLAVISAIAIFSEYVFAQPVRYDQRQEGDLNVRTDVEDVVFVVVPPQDLVAAGMGLMAATAADFFRKNYGGIGPERWPVRTFSKLGFVPLEKSPYKIDLEKSGIKVKKISQVGDPNRYSFPDGKFPTKAKTTSTEAPEKLTMEIFTDMLDETQSTTESKTVKKVLKPEEIKMASEEKKSEEQNQKEKINPEPELVKKSDDVITRRDEKIMEEFPKVVGEGTKGDSDPTSILRLEGCGPDGKRDSTGKCIIKKL